MCVKLIYNVSSSLHSQGVTIIKPIIYGNIARYFGKKREEDGHTHQWTVYVKPYRNEAGYFSVEFFSCVGIPSIK